MQELTIEYYKSYMDLMFKFSNIKKEMNEENFNEILMNKNIKIIIYIDNNDVIGAGSIFKLNKLHNNPVGQIEDLMIDEKYRNKGIGKKIIEKLTHIAFNDFKCYKVILNCLNKNIEFYEKCNFYNSGVQMRFK